jgi:solute:Na+ symporter, SSS family
MTTLDTLILIAYFVVVLGAGFWYKKRASRDLESYFLGGKRMHWLALSMSGSVSTFDITGTMWIVSILYVLGMKSMWHHWMWGVFMAAFFMGYMGKWVRRSNVMTAAEWMKTRFGDGPSGRLARTAYAIMAVVFLTTLIGYAYQGIGKFAAVYIPLDALAAKTAIPWLQELCTTYEKDVLAVCIIGITTLYVVLGGLYTVVVTDVIQTLILTIAALFIGYVAWARLTPELLSQLPPDWTSLAVPWRIPEMAGTDNAHFEFFGALVLVWVAKGLLLNASGPAQMFDFQRFLAARDARDASKIGAAWSLFLVVRWGMTVGIALLALTGVVSVTDSEKIMPLVLRDMLPTGIRGLVIAGLMAAFMSTFSSTLNGGASFIVRDLWQPYFKPDATDHQAITFSHVATVLMVFVGILIGFGAGSIAQVWNWAMMALGGVMIVPNVLRWYWWRMNGWGYSVATLGGLVLAVPLAFFPDIPTYYAFPVIALISLVLSVVVSLATKPTESAILAGFYTSVRPFGIWKPVREQSGLSAEEVSERSESMLLTVTNVVLGMAAICGMYLAPMYLVGHWYDKAFAWFAVFVVTAVTLKFTWYDYLPEPGENG